MRSKEYETQYRVGAWCHRSVYWHPMSGLSWEMDWSYLVPFSNDSPEIEWQASPELTRDMADNEELRKLVKKELGGWYAVLGQSDNDAKRGDGCGHHRASEDATVGKDQPLSEDASETGYGEDDFADECDSIGKEMSRMTELW